MYRFLFAPLCLIATGCSQQAEIDQLKSSLALYESENTRLRAEADRADAGSERFDACVADVWDAYSSNWNKSCARQREADLRARKNCIDSGVSEESCAAVEIGPARSCGLPDKIADRHEAHRVQQEKHCMERLRIGR